jgi:phosphohistidine phosphatase
MIVYFLRHASAGTRHGNSTQDEKRPLDKDGIEQCASIGRLLASIDAVPDIILSSPLKRAFQTATLVANEIGYEQDIELTPAMRPDANYEAFSELLREHSKAKSVMVVGHNPTISSFFSLLMTGGANNTAIAMKKGAVASVDYAAKRCTLNWIVTPKIARTLQPKRQSKSRPKTSRK